MGVNLSERYRPGGLYYLYLRQAALLRVLDPLIERFIIQRIAT